ncbi:MAG: hypothetical protein KBT41_07395 [bacterium]|nr:hypothetical protein [Candidatus Colousia faecequi]
MEYEKALQYSADNRETYETLLKGKNDLYTENLLISKYLTYEPPLDKRHGIAAMVGTALLMVA